MKVMNSSNTQKILRSNKMDLVFPPGVSEQPDIPQVQRFLSMHPEMSVYVEEEKAVVEESKENIVQETKKSKRKSKKQSKVVVEETSDKED